MKIGILTFHNAYNYGAVLQTYATQKLFHDMGHDVTVIDYRSTKFEAFYGFGIKKIHQKLWRTFKKVVRNILSFFNNSRCKAFNKSDVDPLSVSHKHKKYYIGNNVFEIKDPHQRLWSVFQNVIKDITFYYFNNNRFKAFNKFKIEHLYISDKRYYIDNPCINGYDIILIGSDQIWSTGITGGFDKFYWGDFNKDNTTRLVAWAASAGEVHFTSTERSKIKGFLSNFTAISVREEKLKKYISALTNKSVYNIIDPTLLLRFDQWLELCVPVSKKHYVLIFAMSHEVETIIIGKRLAKIKGLDFIVIPTIDDTSINYHYKHGAGPSEFVSYFNNADYVVFCSFHALAFSVILQKQFFCYIKTGTNNIRIESLLHQLVLEDRIVSQDETFNNIFNIDYNEVDAKLDALKVDAMKFVNKILGQ